MLAAFPFLMMALDGGSATSAGTASTTVTTSGPSIFVLSPTGVFQFLVLSILLTLIYVGLICMVSVYANSVKEASTMITPAYMAIMVLGLVSMFTNDLPSLWVFATPVYGTLMGMKYALSAELTWAMFGLNMLISVGVVVGIIWIIRQMFNSEKIMFGA
jgi:sodium transport system permease protein